MNNQETTTHNIIVTSNFSPLYLADSMATTDIKEIDAEEVRELLVDGYASRLSRQDFAMILTKELGFNFKRDMRKTKAVAGDTIIAAIYEGPRIFNFVEEGIPVEGQIRYFKIDVIPYEGEL